MNKPAQYSNRNVVSQTLQQEKLNIEKILPKHISIDKFMQVAYTAALKFPELEECTQESLAIAFISCAQDGLLPDGREAAIVSYNKKVGERWVKVAQYQPMVEGVLKRLRMSSKVKNIIAKVVYKNEKFNHWIDIDGEHLMHQPVFDEKQRGELSLVYAMAKLDNGEVMVEVMLRSEVEEIMMNSKSAVDKNGNLKPYSVWAQHFDRMALKTVIHRIARRLPNSSEVMTMLERDIDYNLINNDKSQQETQNKAVENKAALSPEKQQELKALVQQTATNEKDMFNWISTNQSTGNHPVSDYCDLTDEQYQILLNLLQKRLAKKVQTERETYIEQSQMVVNA